MKEGYVLALKESRTIISRLRSLLEEKNISVRVVSDTIPGYEISYNIDELFVLKKHLSLAEPIIKEYKNPELTNYIKFLQQNEIEIAGIEYMTDVQGVHYTYDVNTNTNYNSVAEKNVGMFGMKQIAIFLKEELNKII